MSYYLLLAFVLLAVLFLRPVDGKDIWASELSEGLRQVDQGSNLSGQARFPPIASLTVGYGLFALSKSLDILAPGRPNLELLLAGIGFLTLCCGLVLAALSLPSNEYRIAAIPGALVAIFATTTLDASLLRPQPYFGLAALAAGALLYCLANRKNDSGFFTWAGLGLIAGLASASGLWAMALGALVMVHALQKPAIKSKAFGAAAGFIVGILPAVYWYHLFKNAQPVPVSITRSRELDVLIPWIPAALISIAGLGAIVRRQRAHSIALGAVILLLIMSGKTGRLADGSGAAAPLVLVTSAYLFHRLDTTIGSALAVAAGIVGIVLNMEALNDDGLSSLLAPGYSSDPLSAISLVPTVLIGAAIFMAGFRYLIDNRDNMELTARKMLLIGLSVYVLIALSCFSSYYFC